MTKPNEEHKLRMMERRIRQLSRVEGFTPSKAFGLRAVGRSLAPRPIGKKFRQPRDTSKYNQENTAGNR